MLLSHALTRGIPVVRNRRGTRAAARSGCEFCSVLQGDGHEVQTVVRREHEIGLTQQSPSSTQGIELLPALLEPTTTSSVYISDCEQHRSSLDGPVYPVKHSLTLTPGTLASACWPAIRVCQKRQSH
jgi:hypothetical protein